uniref:Uncharacterized protein n=1 Tax=Arundo donax TaxID=35708 RepID=A0A0A9AVN2_ARUDO
MCRSVLQHFMMPKELNHTLNKQ